MVGYFLSYPGLNQVPTKQPNRLAVMEDDVICDNCKTEHNSNLCPNCGSFECSESKEKAPACNSLVGKRFTRGALKYVVTWNDEIYLRATPLACKTGLTSHQFIVTEIDFELAKTPSAGG